MDLKFWEWWLWRVLSLTGNLHFLATCFMLVSCLAYSSTLKIEDTYSAETSAEFQRTTQRYIPEDSILYMQYLVSLYFDDP
jgi:hypothetical protein